MGGFSGDMSSTVSSSMGGGMNDGMNSDFFGSAGGGVINENPEDQTIQGRKSSNSITDSFAEMGMFSGSEGSSSPPPIAPLPEAPQRALPLPPSNNSSSSSSSNNTVAMML